MIEIVIQKRLSTRFFKEASENSTEAFDSPVSGTMIDSVITSAQHDDFFIVPSKAPKGATARPTKFIIVRNDLKNQLKLDIIKELSHNMCYMYQNWEGAIRVPAPCMYAHKIAYLFGLFINGTPNPNLMDKLFFL
jgi:aubergine